MSDAVTRRWQDADEAVESLVTALSALVTRAEHRSSRKRPRGRALPKRGDKSTRRYLAEVIRSHRLAPGLRVDRNMIAALFTGHRELVGNPVLVVAVAQASGIIAGRKLTGKEAARLRAASERVARLIRRAQEAGPVPAPALTTIPAPASVPAEETVETPPPAPSPPAERMATPRPPTEPTEPAATPVPSAERGATPLSSADRGAEPETEATPAPEPVFEDADGRRYWPIAAVALLLALAALGVLLLR